LPTSYASTQDNWHKGGSLPRSLRLHNVLTGHARGPADNDQLVGLALQQTDSAGVPLLSAWLKHEAGFLVKRRWAEICAVANALLERKTLSGDEVRDIINARYGPLPEFRRRTTIK